MPEESKAKQTIDLGLGDILKGVDEHASSNGATSTSEPEPAKLAEVEKSLSPFEKLAQAKQWSELEQTSESTLSDASDPQTTLEARLWWVRAQLALKSVPPGILAAPLENAFSEVKQFDQQGKLEPLLKKLAIEDLELLADYLESQDDYGTSLTFRQHAHGLGSTDRGKFKRTAEQELERLRKHEDRFDPEVKSRISKLEDLVRSLEGFAGEVSREQSEKEEKQDPRAGNIVSSWSGTPQRIAFWVVVALIGVGVGAALPKVLESGFWPFSSSKGELSVVTRYSLDPEVRTPDLARIDTISELGTLLYGIKGADNTKNDSTTGAGSSPASQVVDDSASLTAPSPSRTQVAARRNSGMQRNGTRTRGVVDTSGPLEPRSVREAIDNQQPDDGSLASLPSRSTPYSARSGHAGVIGYPVKRFPSYEHYEILASTKVRARPNSRSSYIGVLEAGDTVQVQEIIGDWLRLRALDGRSGFIPTRYARPK